MSRPSIPIVDARSSGAGSTVEAIRRRLSPQGDIVTAAGRQKTLAVFGEPLTAAQSVTRICQAVQSEGIAAVCRFTKAFDGVELSPDDLRVSAERLHDAHANADPEFLAAIRQVRDHLLAFQTSIRHPEVCIRPRPGVVLRQEYRPLRRVGICVPGGAAAYPSTVLMTAVPAQAAGVDEIAVVAPPTPFGADNPDILTVCHELGIDEVYRIGGAQGVAALAYGVPNMPRVDKIVGPGNLFVALAKKHVYGTVDIDSIAGPSEVVIIADDSANPHWVAADMIAQAEHAPGASILLATDEGLVRATLQAMERQTTGLPRGDLAWSSLCDFGAILLLKDIEDAIQACDRIAPEHLHVQTRSPGEVASRIRNAGAVFLGDYTPVALGDYLAGPSHVLPTSGTAVWASGLSINSFLRGQATMEYTADAIREAAPAVTRFAERESLPGHARSVTMRCHPPETEALGT